MKKTLVFLVLTLLVFACGKSPDPKSNSAPIPFKGSLNDLKLPAQAGNWKMVKKEDFPALAKEMEEYMAPKPNSTIKATETVGAIYKLDKYNSIIQLRIFNFSSPEEANRQLSIIQKNLQARNDAEKEAVSKDKQIVSANYFDVRAEPKIVNGQRVGEKLTIDAVEVGVGSRQSQGTTLNLRSVIWTNGSLLIDPYGSSMEGNDIIVDFEKAFSAYY